MSNYSCTYCKKSKEECANCPVYLSDCNENDCDKCIGADKSLQENIQEVISFKNEKEE